MNTMEWLIVVLQIIMLVACYRAFKWVVREYKRLGRERRRQRDMEKFFEEIAKSKDLDDDSLDVVAKHYNDML